VRAANHRCKLVLSIILLTVGSTFATNVPVGQPEYDLVYDRFEREEVFSRNRFDYQLGPYVHAGSLVPSTPFDDRNRLTTHQIQVFGLAAESFRAAQDKRGRMYALFRGGIAGQPIKNLSVLGQFYLDERKARDPNYTGKKWRGYAGNIDLAFAQYSTEWFDLTAGRFSSFWGVRHSLVLGNRSHLDGFGYTLRWGRLSVSYRFAQLGQDMAPADTISQWPNRYFAGHRFDYHFSGALRAGLFETVIWGGPGRSVDLAYLNPIVFFHGSQLNDKVNDNTLVGVDFTWKPVVGMKLYGQVVIDDIQLDHKTQGDQEPAEYGLLIGVYTASKVKKIDTRLEYVRVTNRTFNQILSRNRYTSGRDPIGDVLGNDYDLTTAEIIRWLKPNLSARLNLSYRQQGEGRINDIWTEPWLDMTGNYSEKFPTGTVEKTGSVSLALHGFINSFLFTDLKVGVSRAINYDNHAGDNRTLPFIDCYVSLYFAKILSLD
jgi:hypothetical protein